MFWQQIHQLDQQITLCINSWNSPFSDPVWQFFSDKWVWIPMYLGIVALMIWKLGWKKGLIVIAAAGLTFAFCDQFSNLVKVAVGRIRPCNDEFMLASGLHVLETGGSFSFFSAHAANAIGLAASTFTGLKSGIRLQGCTESPRWVKTYGGWMFFWAAMVGISRIFVGRHYLGDVMVGFIVGAAAGIIFGRLARWVMNKYFTR